MPDNPGAWRMTTAKRRALDGMRDARAVRGDLLAKLGRGDEARAEFSARRS